MGIEDLRPWFKRFRSNFYVIFPVIILIICFFTAFAYSTIDVHNNTDSSWQYSLSGLRHSSQQTLGKNVFFNYGPLFERMVTVVHAKDSLNNFILSNLIFLLIVIINSFALVRLTKSWEISKHPLLRNLLILSGAFLFISFSDIDSLFYICLLITLFAAYKEPRLGMKLLLLTGLYLFSLYKLNYSLPLLVLSYFAFIDGYTVRRLAKSLIPWAGSLLLFCALYFVLIGTASLSGLAKYLYYGTINSVYYNEFMSLPLKLHEKVQIAYIFSFGIVAIAWLLLAYKAIGKSRASKKWGLVVGGFIFILTDYLAFKHAIVRSDAHLYGFLPFIFLSMLFVLFCLWPAGFSKRKPVYRLNVASGVFFIIALAISFLLFHIFVVGGMKAYAKSKSQLVENLWQRNRLSYGLFESELYKSGQTISVRAKDIQDINNRLAAKYPGRGLVFYGNTTLYGEILKQHRPVLYMPFLQNYSAHPPQIFDAAYINFLEQHPNDLVFAEETEPSINERVPAHELDNFFQYLIHDYRVVLENKEKHQFVFAKISNDSETCREVAAVNFKDDEEVGIPRFSTDNGQYMKLFISTKPSAIESLYSAAVKKPIYSIFWVTPGGAEMMRRTTPAILKHGIVVDPLYQNIIDFDNHSPFDLKSLIINDGFPTRSKFQAKAYSCHY